MTITKQNNNTNTVYNFLSQHNLIYMKKLMNTNVFSTAIKSVSILLVALLFSVGAKAGVPGAPTIASVQPASATSVVVAVTAPASNGGAAITSYTVQAYTYPGNVSTGTALTITVASGTITNVTGTYSSSLVQTQAYYFKATATNSAGTSSASAASVPVTPGSPSPFNVIAYEASATSATVTWTAPTLSGGGALNSVLSTSAAYSVIPYDVTNSAAGTAVSVASPATLTANVTGLTTGHIYTFTVTALNTYSTPTTSSPSIASLPLTLVTTPAVNNYTGANGWIGIRQATGVLVYQLLLQMYRFLQISV